MFTVTKKYSDFPAAHRQPKHEGHCHFIHGHNWAWEITFTCDELDKNGFVVDVGGLDVVKRFFNDHFDHTLVVNGDDPLIDKGLKSLDELGFVQLVVVDNCGMEGLARFVFHQVNKIVKDWGRGLKVINVRCWEDSKNSASYNER